MSTAQVIARLLPALETPRRPVPDTAEAAVQDPIAIAKAVAAQLAQTAVERDRAGGHPAAERGLLRNSGLLWLSIPTEFGGPGHDWATVYQVVRILAGADSALAHLYGFHHLQLAGVLLYGTAEQQQRYLRATLEQKWFWGNALNPLDKRTVAEAEGEHWRIDGQKSFSSGSVGSDVLTFSAWHEESGTALIAAIPTTRKGVTVHADWDAFGQKQTDSGTVSFAGVELRAEEVLQAPAVAATPRATLRSCVAQLVMTNLYLGIAEGAYESALRYTRDEARAWFASGVPRSADDPFIQRRYGELRVKVRAAAALADEAARRLDAAFRKGAALTAADRGEVAVAIADAKVLAHEASLTVSSDLFDILGARATSQRYGFDRYWRNARTHTLHDPIDYKLRDLGRYAIDGRHPDPTPYS
ncbi:acyl-CoA dehydrogenase family protein [Chitinimonas sp.]|uniref:acyl-CoA dehydrogenase family protein n=1 Tax=Chitinimonas sp. TaxID=1934313 RepID=UPI002F92CAF9